MSVWICFETYLKAYHLTFIGIVKSFQKLYAGAFSATTLPDQSQGFPSPDAYI